MSVIGEQIKKYRTEKGLTQEQLGEMIGVTMQAVSRWERGGAPDCEMLPSLANALNVSIDALFGQEEQSITTALAQQLCRMPREKAFPFALEICWAMEIGLHGDAASYDDYGYKFVNWHEVNHDSSEYFSEIMHDCGIATARLSTDFQHFFLMTEPRGSLRDVLSEPAKLRHVFSILANEKVLTLIYYLYARLNTPIATSLIAKHTGFSPEEVETYMQLLCENDLAAQTTIAIADGEMHSYMFNKESAVISLLCFADEIAKKDKRVFLWDFTRTKPLLGID